MVKQDGWTEHSWDDYDSTILGLSQFRRKTLIVVPGLRVFEAHALGLDVTRMGWNAKCPVG
jgi:hypothetical protein